MRPRCLLLALFLLAGVAPNLSPLVGAESPVASRLVRVSFRHQDRSRLYLVRLPKGHKPKVPRPLVMALHGGGGSADALDRGTNGQFSREADKRGWLVCFPQGISKGWNDGRKLVSFRDRRRSGVDDVAFLSVVIDRIVSSHGADPTRVYATGISNGGFMSYRLGLELSEKVAAIAPVTANLQRVHASKRPKHAVGLMVFNGTKDPLVPYEGGEVRVFGRARGRIFSTDETMQRWAAFNGCRKPPTAAALPDRVKTDGARAYRLIWPGCKKGAQVELIRIEGGGHTWPGGRRNLPKAMVGAICQDFRAVPMMFDFFARHRRVATASK